MAALHQFRRHTAEKMRVAVVPIRNKGMIEHDDLHAATSSTTSGCFPGADENSSRMHVRYAARYSLAIRCGENSRARTRARRPYSCRRRVFSIKLLRALANPVASSDGTKMAEPCHVSRKLGMSARTNAQPLNAASSTDKPNGS